MRSSSSRTPPLQHPPCVCCPGLSVRMTNTWQPKSRVRVISILTLRTQQSALLATHGSEMDATFTVATQCNAM